MTYRIQPFPGVPYPASDWVRMLANYGAGSTHAQMGILPDALNGPSVDLEYNTMQVTVRKGAGFVNGRWVQCDADTPFTLGAADPTYDRYDLIVGRTNKTAKTFTWAVIQGTASANPGVPACDVTDDPVYEIPLAAVRVRANAAALLHGDLVQYNRQASAAGQIIVPVYNLAATDSIWRGQPCRLDHSADTTHRGRMRNAFGVQPWTYTGGYPMFGVALTGIPAGQWGLAQIQGPMCLLYKGDQNPYLGQHVGFELISPPAGDETWAVVNDAPYPIGWAMENAPYRVGIKGWVWVYVDAMLMNAPRIYRKVYAEAADLTTTSTVWADVLNVINLFYGPLTRYVRLRFSGVVSHATAGATISLNVAVDGVDQSYPIWQVSAPAANYRIPVTIDTLLHVGNQAFAFHTYQLRWKVSAGTGKLHLAAGYPRPTISVEEVHLTGYTNPPDF